MPLQSKKRMNVKLKKKSCMIRPQNQLIVVNALTSLCNEISNQHNGEPPAGPNDILYTTAVNITRGAITDTVEHLFQRHNIPLPPNWTYGQLVTDILGNDLTLQNVSSVLQNITQLGLASDEFHQLLNF